MDIRGFFNELKRRNVVRVATTYAVVAWLLIQVSATIEAPLSLPHWFDTLIIILVAAGFPLALILAWAFELTPEGIKRSSEVNITESVTRYTGKKLNRLTITVLILIIFFLLVERFYFALATPEKTVEIEAPTAISNQSVAVLPFADLSENHDQDWFSDGLTEEILNSLAQLPELKVTSRTSAFQFKGKDLDISRIADTLGVANVVEGSVRRIGDQLRITAQLIRANDGFHLWSKTYDSKTENLFKVQTSIAEEIATTLDVLLDEELREKMFATETRNVEAFQEYLKGVEAYREAHEGNMSLIWEANRHFDRALELDPGFGNASLYKMDAYAHILIDGMRPPENLTQEEAKIKLKEALQHGTLHLRSPILKVTTEMNLVFFSDSWYQLPNLLKQFKEVLNQTKRVPGGSIWLNEILGLYDEFEILERDTKADIELDPLNLNTWVYRAYYLYNKEGLDALREVFRDSRKVIGSNILIDKVDHFYLGISGQKEVLKSIYSEGFTGAEIEEPILMVVNAYIAAALGNNKLAEDIMVRYRRKVNFEDDWAALVYYEMGEVEKAKALIRQIDSQPAGPTNLAITMGVMGKHRFFELEDAPNTVARFREAGIDLAGFKKMYWLE